jgi:hypothetical protein
LSCDSGSNKVFDFVGLPELVQELGAIISSIYERAVFFREKQFLVRIEAVAAALPVLEEISALHAQKKLGNEEAELLRRGIVSGATKFLKSGAITPQLSSISSIDPQRVLTTEPTLLLTGPKRSNVNKLRKPTKNQKSERSPKPRNAQAPNSREKLVSREPRTSEATEVPEAENRRGMENLSEEQLERMLREARARSRSPKQDDE